MNYIIFLPLVFPPPLYKLISKSSQATRRMREKRMMVESSVWERNMRSEKKKKSKIF